MLGKASIKTDAGSIPACLQRHGAISDERKLTGVPEKYWKQTNG